MRAVQTKKLASLLLIATVFLFLNSTIGTNIPVTGLDLSADPVKLDSFTGYRDDDRVPPVQLSISEFVANISDGQGESVRGVYATGLFALQVVQQPSGNAGYVSAEEDVATQFSMAKKYDSIGLLAHNNAAGQYFYNLTYGNIVEVVYGDGNIDLYKVEAIYEFQALSPSSTSSSFKDLVSGETFSAANVFYKMYSGDPHLTLQTCIQKDGINTWGRLFIIAYPL